MNEDNTIKMTMTEEESGKLRHFSDTVSYGINGCLKYNALECPDFNTVDFTPYAKGKKVADAVRFIVKSTPIEEVLIQHKEADIKIEFTDVSKANPFLDCLSGYEVTYCAIKPFKILTLQIIPSAVKATKPTTKKKK